MISQLAAGRKNRLWLEVDGGRHTVDVRPGERRVPPVRLRGRHAGAEQRPQSGSAEQRRLATLPAGHTQGYAQSFEAFVADSYAAVRAHSTGEPAPEGLPTFADGARAAAICDAMLDSADRGTWVSVKE